MRKRYLDNYDLDQALDLYINKIADKIKLESQIINVSESLNYISCNAVYAKSSSPNYNASAMDGVAIKSIDSALASEINPVFIDKKDCLFVDTGDVINSNYDAVVMIEDVVVQDEKIMITKPVAYFDHIRAIGEDITQTQMIIPSYHKIRAVDIGPLIASKNEYVKVFKKLKTAIIPTGTEIVSVNTEKLEDGMIIDSNSSMIKALTNELNIEAKVMPIIKDDYEILKKQIIEYTKDNDVILINAGSSAGSEDYTASIIDELGEVIIHGIAIKPGKPAILGIINETMIIGLPGYPVSTYIVFEQVFKPLINKLFKQKINSHTIEAKLTRTIYSSLKYLEFVRVKIGYVNNEFICTPLARGAGVSMSLAEADGVIMVSKELEGYTKGSLVDVVLLKDVDYLKNKITLIGSHDLILDVIQDVINIQNKPFSLSSNHVGSYAGLLSLKSKESNIAPIHILDENGTYNVEIVKKMFSNENMVLIKGVKRRQVLAYYPDNPKQINSIIDITRSDISYVNRQRGSGTAILLDYLIKENNLDETQVNGYDFIMPSHFNVAAAIKNKTADCGLLIKSIADVLNLDYLEVMSEEYDFLIYESDLETEKIKMFIDLLKSDLFKEKLEQFDCYDTTLSGTIIKI